jgi:hypothetical protein
MNKYPRTNHLPWSPGASSDDKILKSLDTLLKKEIVITEKMDGENTTGYSSGYIHARSLTSSYHQSRTWVNAFLKERLYQLPDGWRICGENVFACHSVPYENLDSYFFGFSIWNEKNQALSWDDTVEWFELLEIVPVPVLWRGILLSKTFLRSFSSKINQKKQEGFVVRLVDSFSFEDFPSCVAKWVRPGHVQTDRHWIHSKVVENKLK